MGCLALNQRWDAEGVGQGQGCFGWLSFTWLVCPSGKSWVRKKLGNECHCVCGGDNS